MKIALNGKRARSRVLKTVVCGFYGACLLAAMIAPGQAAEPPAQKPMTMAEIVAAAKPEDWRALDAENTLYLELAGGRVVIELAPLFAPLHVANVKALAREHYFDGLAIIRVQDNYVVQWGDPEADNPQKAHKIQRARKTLPAEFDRAGNAKIPFTPLPDGDVYAEVVGFCDGLPAARDRRSGRMWLTHCYGMVGAGRGDASDSGGGHGDLRGDRSSPAPSGPQCHPVRAGGPGDGIAVLAAPRERPDGFLRQGGAMRGD